MTNIKCPYCSRDFCFNYEDVEELCTDENRGDWEFIKLENKYTLVIFCPYCGKEIYFTQEGERLLNQSIEKSKSLRKLSVIQLTTAYGYRLEEPKEDMDAFPPENSELILAIKGTSDELQDLSPEFIDLSIKKGANTLAIDFDDSFLVYILKNK